MHSPTGDECTEVNEGERVDEKRCDHGESSLFVSISPRRRASTFGDHTALQFALPVQTVGTFSAYQKWGPSRYVFARAHSNWRPCDVDWPPRDQGSLKDFPWRHLLMTLKRLTDCRLIKIAPFTAFSIKEFIELLICVRK
jgi:hypothetical protein